MDYETDRVIQATIREEFGDCTVLCVAHRLKTVMDSSRILVMKEGRLVEFDQPQALLLRPDSHFTQLVKSEMSLVSGREQEQEQQPPVEEVGLKGEKVRSFNITANSFVAA